MKKALFASAIALPVVSFGQEGLKGTVDTFGSIVAAATPIAFALALLFFFYGLAMFILKSGEDKESGKNIMIWGTIALFIMTSIFGIIEFLQNTFDIKKNADITVPNVLGK